MSALIQSRCSSLIILFEPITFRGVELLQFIPPIIFEDLELPEYFHSLLTVSAWSSSNEIDFGYVESGMIDDSRKFSKTTF